MKDEQDKKEPAKKFIQMEMIDKLNIKDDVGEFEEKENDIFSDSDGICSGFNFKNISWRDIVDKKHLYINKEFFKRKGEEAPESIDDCSEQGIIVKLSALKDLAIRHGYRDISYRDIYVSDSRISFECTIIWNPTKYNGFRKIKTIGIASAGQDNCSGDSSSFREAIAANRAFARAVRDYFGIFAVSDEEMDKSSLEKVSMESSNTIQPKTENRQAKLLQKKVSEKLSMDVFLEFKEKYLFDKKDELGISELIDSWQSFTDIPDDICKKIKSKVSKE